MVNSSWTLGHIASLWGGKPVVVYPPCDVEAFRKLPVKAEDEAEMRILSIGQFRPEKDHALQLRSFARYLAKHPQGARAAVLVLAGSCRNAEDEERVAALQKLASDLSIPDQSISWRLNIDFAQLKEEVSRATIGLHSMWCEHFGIAVVEAMAGGNIVVAHNSGGPAMDIVGPEGEGRGFLASTEEEYAAAFARVEALSRAEREEMRRRARESTARFSDHHFHAAFLAALHALIPKSKTN